MSNLELDSQPTEVTDAPIFDDGQGEATIDVPEVPAEPEYDFLEIDDTLANKYVKAKFGDEEVPVTLNEALQGYQRQADYTRKTQEAAAIRREAEEALRLQQALRTSPGLTVQVLAQQAGVTVEEFLGMTPSQQRAVVEDAEPEYEDPLERQLAEERRSRIALEQRLDAKEADEYLRGQIGRLKQTYQIDDDEVRAVVGQALEMGVGPEAFPMIYQSMAYQKLQAQTEAQRTAAQQKEQDDAKRRAAAAAASQVVTSGTGATNVTPISSANGITTARDAVLAAFDQLELS